MKKRILGTILAAALIVSQAVTAFAAGSRTSDVALSGDSIGSYEVAEASAEVFADVAEQSQSTYDAIMEINSGSASLQSLTETIRSLISGDNAELAMTEEQVNALEQELEGKSMVTSFFDLKAVNGGVQDADGSYVVTLSVPALSDTMSDVKLLHYSVERNLWEVITPDDVDYSAKEITAAFQDLSPVAVIADVDASAADTSVGTSPQTGVMSTWMLWAGAALLLAAAAFAAGRKVRR